jgi:hypothetical protein
MYIKDEITATLCGVNCNYFKGSNLIFILLRFKGQTEYLVHPKWISRKTKMDKAIDNNGFTAIRIRRKTITKKDKAKDKNRCVQENSTSSHSCIVSGGGNMKR